MAYRIMVAYDMYLELAEGKCDETWKVAEPVDFWTFRDILSTQMLKYDPRAKKYKGDANFRVNTQLSRAQSERRVARAEAVSNNVAETTPVRTRGCPAASASSSEKDLYRLYVL